MGVGSGFGSVVGSGSGSPGHRVSWCYNWDGVVYTSCSSCYL